jgi:hypothetical protein
LNDGWDLLMVAHPPCTRLCNSGVRWLTKPPAGKTLEQMWAELDEAAALFSTLWNAPIPRICIENPVMHRHAKERIVGYQSLRPKRAAVAVRPRRDEAHLLLAQEPAGADPHRHCRGAGATRPPDAARS